MANRGGDVTRLLVAGGGLIGARHCAQIELHPECTLVGLVDPNPASAPQINTPRFADFSAVDVPVDGIVIATPTGLHCEHGLIAAQRGWPMLIEKPVAADLSQAQTLASAVHAAKLPSLVGHHRRYHHSVQLLRDQIRAGEIGQPITCSLIWAMRKPDDYFAGNWRSADGSPVMINLVHDIDLLRFWFGEISQVVALPGARLRDSKRIESGAVSLRFESGMVASVVFADNAPSPWGFEAATGENPNIGTTRQDMMWITGSRGGVSFPSLTRWGGAVDWSMPAQIQSRATTTDTNPPLRAQLGHFLDVIAGRAAPLIDIADATRTLAIAQQIEETLTTNAFPEQKGFLQ